MLLPKFTLKQAAQAFFDRRPIDRSVDRARFNALGKAGAFVRRRARSSIRKRKAPSRPGSPPTNRTGHLRDRIVFFYDAQQESVVIGPTILNKHYKNGHGKPEKGTVPQLLEEGGNVGILCYWSTGKKQWVRANLSNKRYLQSRVLQTQKFRIAARPYMGPALAAERPKFAELFLNSVN